jgi:hypothetical protein
MEAITSKMRSQYKGYAQDRATIEMVDGVQMAKRRKLSAMVGGSCECWSLALKALRLTDAVFSPQLARRR